MEDKTETKLSEAERSQKLDANTTTAQAIELGERSLDGFSSISSLKGSSEADMPWLPDNPTIVGSEEGSSISPLQNSLVEVNQPSDEDFVISRDKVLTDALVEEVQKLYLRKRLSGAQKKRYRWHLKQGRTPEEAHSLCLKPMAMRETPLNVDKKRNSCNRLTLDGVGGSEAQTMSQTNNRQATEGVKIGILHANFPETQLGVEQLESIQEAILELILEDRAKLCKPCFHGIQRRPGYLILNCENEPTAEWLLEVVPGIKPWKGAEIMAVPEGEIPRNKIVTAYFPNSKKDPSSKILGYLGAQNRGLDVENWKVLHRSEEGNVSQLTIAVDHATASRLEKEGPRISYKFGKVELRIKKRDSKPMEEAQQSTHSQGGNEDDVRVQVSTGMPYHPSVSGTPTTSGYMRTKKERKQSNASAFLKTGPTVKGPSTMPKTTKDKKKPKGSRKRNNISRMTGSPLRLIQESYER